MTICEETGAKVYLSAINSKDSFLALELFFRACGKGAAHQYTALWSAQHTALTLKLKEEVHASLLLTQGSWLIFADSINNWVFQIKYVWIHLKTEQKIHFIILSFANFLLNRHLSHLQNDAHFCYILSVPSTMKRVKILCRNCIGINHKSNTVPWSNKKMFQLHKLVRAHKAYMVTLARYMFSGITDK